MLGPAAQGEDRVLASLGGRVCATWLPWAHQQLRCTWQGRPPNLPVDVGGIGGPGAAARHRAGAAAGRRVAKPSWTRLSDLIH